MLPIARPVAMSQVLVQAHPQAPKDQTGEPFLYDDWTGTYAVACDPPGTAPEAGASRQAIVLLQELLQSGDQITPAVLGSLTDRLMSQTEAERALASLSLCILRLSTQAPFIARWGSCSCFRVRGDQVECLTPEDATTNHPWTQELSVEAGDRYLLASRPVSLSESLRSAWTELPQGPEAGPGEDWTAVLPEAQAQTWISIQA